MSVWLSRAELPWSRRLLAMASMLPWAWAAWNHVYIPWARHGWASLSLLVMAALLLHLAHPVAQLTARAVLWATVLVGVVHFDWSAGLSLHAHLASKNFGVIAAGCALLALGGACLRTGSGSFFTPVAFRRTLLASLVGALVQMLLLSLVLLSDAAQAHPRRVVFDLACLAAVGLGAVGTYRLRAWGPLLTWLTTAGLGVLLALDCANTRVAGVVLLKVSAALDVARGWMAMSAVMVVVMLPLVAAIVRGSAGRAARGA